MINYIKKKFIFISIFFYFRNESCFFEIIALQLSYILTYTSIKIFLYRSFYDK